MSKTLYGSLTVAGIFKGTAVLFLILWARLCLAGDAQNAELQKFMSQVNFDARGLKALLAGGAQADAGTYRNTPLCIAIEKNNQNAAEILIKHGARVYDVNCPIENGYTRWPIQAASAKGWQKIVSLMVPAVRERHSDVLARAMCSAIDEGRKETTEYLIKSGANISSNACESGSPLDVAANRGYAEIADLLLDRGAQIEGNHRPRSPLCRATAKGHKAVVAVLLDHGAGLNNSYCDEENGTVLALASSKGHQEIVSLFLERGSSVNGKNSMERPALHAASVKGNIEIAKLLIAKGANVNAPYDDDTAVAAAARGGFTDLVDYLIAKGAAINQDKFINFPFIHLPLCEAAANGHKVTAELLLARGSDIANCLCFAADKGHIPIADILIARGADVNAVNCFFDGHHNALMAAARSGNTDMIDYLIKKGGKVNSANQNGETALFVATKNGKKNASKLLLARGASASVQTTYGRTALMSAAEKGDPDLVEALIKKGAAINNQDQDGWTALMFAASAGKTAVAVQLVTQGADKNIMSRDNRTAYDFAVVWKHETTASYLKTGTFDTAGDRGFYDGISDMRTIRSIWIDLDKPRGDGNLARRIMRLISPQGISKLAGMGIFLSGPHTGNVLNLRATDSFGHYNKAFVHWMKTHLIPAAEDSAFRISTQPLYDAYIKETARSFYTAYNELHSDSRLLSSELRRYEQHIAQESTFDVRGMKGFWLRRAMDGTDREFHAALHKLLKTYDADFVNILKSERELGDLPRKKEKRLNGRL